MCKLKGQMDKGEHSDVEMKGGWKRWHLMYKSKGGWIREGYMMWKSKSRCKMGQYDVQLKMADG